MNEHLHPFQREALARLQVSRHLLVIAPTGSGKSRVFIEASRLLAQRTLLITPLIALHRQHQQTVLSQGFKAGVGLKERPQAGIWILSPESLHSRQVGTWKPDLLVVDECHTVWEWGEQFRPQFKALLELPQQLQVKKSLWLTATLPSSAREEWLQTFDPDCAVQGEFALPMGLSLTVSKITWPNRMNVLLDFVRKQRQAGVVFTFSRREAERLSRLLSHAGICSSFYHAGLSREERQAIEHSLREGQLQVLISTSAFGMGMDLRNLGWTLIWQVPPTLLALAQQLGRVGRSGQSGHAWVFWCEEDLELLHLFNLDTHDLELFLRSQQCREKMLKAYFNGSQSVQGDCGRCDACRWGKNFLG